MHVHWHQQFNYIRCMMQTLPSPELNGASFAPVYKHIIKQVVNNTVM
jgi:hypothetical protein